MALKQFDHVNVRTNRLEEMIAWYGEVLGLKPGARPPFSFDGAWLYLGGQPIIHLVGVDHTPEAKAPSLEHFALRAEGLGDFLRHLKSRNVEHKVGIVPGFGIIQVNVWDPQGNHIHIDFGPEEKVGAGSGLIGMGAHQQAEVGQEPEIPEVLQRYITGLARHDVAQIAGTVAPDLVFFSQARTIGKAEFLDFLKALYAGFPDWSYDRDPIRVEIANDYIVRWRQGGRHSGVLALPGFAPVQPTGRLVKIPPQDFTYRVAGDLIVEIRPDPVPSGAPRGIFEQIGVATPPL